MTSPSTPRSPSDPHWDRLARYFAGESSREEAAAVERWLSENPVEARQLHRLEELVGGPVGPGGIHVEGALEKVKTRLKQPAPTATQLPRRPWGWAVAGLAAAAAITAIVVAPREGDKVVRPVTAETRVATQAGARDTLVLADGTRITLGPSTSVAVSGREIALEGEAFFTMASEKTGSYSVKAKGMTIRDIGTEFGVRAYADEPLKVMVSSGIVEVAAPGATVVLDSGDVGVVGPAGTLSRVAGGLSADDVAWMQGRLVFRNASMAAMRADLHRWYGVELRVTDTALQRRHFTGSFSGDPVDRVGDVIALALGARAERRGDTLFIRPRR
jgi:transmembrane sensor